MIYLKQEVLRKGKFGKHETTIKYTKNQFMQIL